VLLAEQLKPKKILIVDDNRAATDSLVRLLRALGWNTQGLYSGKEALAYFEHDTADIVFLDIGMPEMDGYELVRKLRAQGHTTIPIIALTGYGLEEDKKKAFDAGFNYHLIKPVGVTELQQVLSQV
jgi:CheY-like chemotaxis protein